MDEVLARSGIFQGVDPEAAEALAKEMDTVEVRKGDVLFNEGEAGDSLYIVLSGKIKLSRRSPDGRENVLAVMGPSDQFGELSVFDPGPRTATATAVTDVKLARMPQSVLRPWIEAHPEIGEQLLRVQELARLGHRVLLAGAGEHRVDGGRDELDVRELLGGDVRDQIVERARLLAGAEVERLEGVVHERRHLAEPASDQLLHGGGACGIRVGRRRKLDREPVDAEDHRKPFPRRQCRGALPEARPV